MFDPELQRIDNDRFNLPYDIDLIGSSVAGSILHMSDLRRVLQNRSQVTIFTTSCYSGGWLVLPDINRQQLNATAKSHYAEV
ncbi:hypothetical protein N7516_001205 [Penicillium verrucosum]|uniref:uncharacterized protein n=1 Tax=Penicillium verrucosum TaxID=60171 RepID=UPI00254568F3|nr:uncharacterized protein N7516_001205 [Penicillium verrucosum]KAJ5941037.1 hypothetical protein N7516_001205 [Penicillium verrucosum]